MRIWLRAAGIVTLALFAAGPALAQTNSEINAGIQFNFSTPGARSLGLGGAFIGLADDATAAFTNPAGLTVLTRPEVSAEGRQFKYTTEFTDGGHSFGSPTGEGIDTVAGLTSRETSETVSGLSFASFVYPRERFVLAVYRHELANFKATMETQGAFIGTAAIPARFFPVRAATELKIIDYGASWATKLTDRLSLGIGVSFYQFDWTALTRRYDIVQTRAKYFGAPDFSDGNVVNQQTIAGNYHEYGFNLGLQWKALDQLTVGFVARQGTKFDFRTVNVGGPSRSTSNGVVFDTDFGRFKVPNVYGIGLVWQPADAFKAAFDWVHVSYGNLTKDTVNVFNDSPEKSTNLTIDSADELHLGLEYAFLGLKTPLVLRAGAWLDPDHRVRAIGATDTIDQQADASLFRGRDDEMHYSGGFGILFFDGKFEINAAYDTSKWVSTGSVSAIYRF